MLICMCPIDTLRFIHCEFSWPRPAGQQQSCQPCRPVVQVEARRTGQVLSGFVHVYAWIVHGHQARATRAIYFKILKNQPHEKTNLCNTLQCIQGSVSHPQFRPCCTKHLLGMGLGGSFENCCICTELLILTGLPLSTKHV